MSFTSGFFFGFAIAWASIMAYQWSMRAWQKAWQVYFTHVLDRRG